MIRKIITAFRLLFFDRDAFVKRLFTNYFGRFDIFIFYIKTKFQVYFLPQKKRLFIDLGSNVGQAYQFFRNIYPNNMYDYILVEPNKFCVEKLNKLIDCPNVEVIEAAAWVSDGKGLLYGLHESGNNLSLGASIIDDHKTKSYNIIKDSALKINTFIFSDLLNEKSEIYEEIIVKMHIESSEYDILENLIKNNNINLIDRLFVEFHSKWMKESDLKDMYKKRERKLIDTLPNYTNLHIWV